VKADEAVRVKLRLDPSVAASWHLSRESSVLAAWYDSHPSVRRLWGMRLAQKLRVVVSVEATHDNSDLLPVWLANRAEWARELSSATGLLVELELFASYPFEGIDLDPGEAVVADLCWRESTLTDGQSW
jgi:hypothetical protein